MNKETLKKEYTKCVLRMMNSRKKLHASTVTQHGGKYLENLLSLADEDAEMTLVVNVTYLED